MIDRVRQAKENSKFEALVKASKRFHLQSFFCTYTTFQVTKPTPQSYKYNLFLGLSTLFLVPLRPGGAHVISLNCKANVKSENTSNTEIEIVHCRRVDLTEIPR